MPLDPVMGGLLAKGVSGLFGLFGAKKAAKQQAKAEATQFVRLRDAAIAGGFNPLTVLNATQGQGFQRVYDPALTSSGFISGLFDGVSEAFKERAAYDREAKLIRLRDELYRKPVVLSRAPRGFGFDLSGPASGAPVPSKAALTFSGFGGIKQRDLVLQGGRRVRDPADNSPATSKDLDAMELPFGLGYLRQTRPGIGEVIEQNYGDNFATGVLQASYLAEDAKREFLARKPPFQYFKTGRFNSSQAVMGFLMDSFMRRMNAKKAKSLPPRAALTAHQPAVD